MLSTTPEVFENPQKCTARSSAQTEAHRWTEETSGIVPIITPIQPVSPLSTKQTAERHTSSMLHVPSGTPGIGNTNKLQFFQLYAMGKKKMFYKQYLKEFLTFLQMSKCLLECEKRDSGG